MTHHGDEHVDEDDDDGDVIEREQKHPDSFHDRRGVIPAGKAVRVRVVPVLARVLDLDAVDANEAEHRPEQAVESSRQSDRIYAHVVRRIYTTAASWSNLRANPLPIEA